MTTSHDAQPTPGMKSAWQDSLADDVTEFHPALGDAVRKEFAKQRATIAASSNPALAAEVARLRAALEAIAFGGMVPDAPEDWFREIARAALAPKEPERHD